MPQDSKITTSRIAVVLPSRGMMMSKTMESVCNNLEGYTYRVFMSHGLPIPDCFNSALERALVWNPTHIWFVEEDMLIPNGTLDTMLDQNVACVAIDYADRRTGVPLAYFNKKGDCMNVGMGCMLVTRGVVMALERPLLRRMVFWIIDTEDVDIEYLEKPDIDTSKEYGTQDIYLCHKIRQMGHKINLLPDIKIGHMQLEKKGEDFLNYGMDQIKEVYIG